VTYETEKKLKTWDNLCSIRSIWQSHLFGWRNTLPLPLDHVQTPPEVSRSFWRANIVHSETAHF